MVVGVGTWKRKEKKKEQEAKEEKVEDQELMEGDERK